MKIGYFFWIIIYFIICIGILVLIIRFMAKKAAPPLKKSPVHYVSISSHDNFDDSFMDVYNLSWKPDRDYPKKVPDEIEKIITKIESISPMVTELSSKLNDPDINPKEISKLIVTDQGLTSFILKRVNSPYYRLAQKVENIFNAIVILGYNEIYRIVMEERTARIGIKPSREEWIHANLTSTIAAYLSGTTRIGVQGGTMVTLGMLHDIAKTIMERSLIQPEEGFSSDPRERLRQETELYGIDHAALGGILARQWQMPERLSKAIEQHHWPMFWPVREIGQISGDTVKELAILSISDIAAKNFLQQGISGIYIGDDYYRFIKKQPRIESIITPEITRDLNRIKLLGGIKSPDTPAHPGTFNDGK
jgi:HD-like signal output (HDOD) protein